MLLPAVVSVAKQTKIPVSKLLIPLSFSSLLGGKITLIGTPANILATSIVAENGLPTFSFFDFAPIGLIVLSHGYPVYGLYRTALSSCPANAGRRADQR